MSGKSLGSLNPHDRRRGWKNIGLDSSYRKSIDKLGECVGFETKLTSTTISNSSRLT